MPAVVLVLAACGNTAPTASPLAASPPVAAETPELDAETAKALRFRTDFGLRADLEFIEAIAVDPRAVMDYGVPLLPEEVREIDRRAADAERIVPIVRMYVAGFAAEFGGLYIDQAHGGRVTVLFTDHLAEHDLALREQLFGVGPVVVRQIRFSEPELTAQQDRISADVDWFDTIDAKLTSVGLDTIGNRIEVTISSRNARAPGLIAAHFQVPPGMLNVHSDGTGAAFIPIVTIRGTVVTADGRTPGNNEYMVLARGPGPGACAGDVDEMGHGVNPDGTFEILCAAGSWTIVIQDASAGPPDGVDLGHAHVVVPPGGVVEMVITLDPPSP
jgi:hypothetical protein